MKKRFKTLIRKLFVIDDTPEKIAGGAALGMFLGMIPGEGIISTLLFSSLFRLNRLAATAGVLSTNMWMTLVILPPSALVGALIFGEDYQSLKNTFESSYHLGWAFFFSEIMFFDFTLPILVGFIVVAGAISVILYLSILYLLRKDKITFTKKSA